MRDEALSFAQRLRDAGIAVTSSVLPSGRDGRTRCTSPAMRVRLRGDA